MNLKNLKNLTPDEELYLKAKELYYKGSPILTDADFDALEDKLRALDSFVIDMVGTGAKSSKKVFLPHKTPMGSLAKIQFKPNYVPYPEYQDFLAISPNSNISYGPKFDGNAINIIYENGELISVTSRGDGVEGQDYTNQMRGNVPNKIKNFTGEIRGEAVVDVVLFETKYKKDGIDPNKKYSNARNFVAGVLGTPYDKSINYDDIDFIAFEIVNFQGNTNAELIKYGFNVADYGVTYLAKDTDEKMFQFIYDNFVAYRKKSKYQLDGIVAKYDESVRDAIGRTSHHPLWALAIKFVTQEVSTKIVDITWSLSKRGELCPVAILEPVNLMDSIVTKASLYNASWMLKNKAVIGATVSLIKSGDIIPKIVEVLIPSTVQYNLPTDWNGHQLKYNDVNLSVDGFENTEEYKAVKLTNSVVALGLEGIGPAMCERLVKAGITLTTLLKETPDGLRMTLLQSGEFKDGRELELLIENVFALTKVELWQVIYAMQYKNCGKTISKQLANWFCQLQHDFKGLEKAVVEAFITSPDAQNDVKELIGILVDNNVKIEYPKALAAGIITYEMTGGAGEYGTKDDFSRLVEATGKCIHTSLSKNTTYLVTDSVGSNTGKMQKANKLGVKIVSYQDFYKLMV